MVLHLAMPNEKRTNIPEHSMQNSVPACGRCLFDCYLQHICHLVIKYKHMLWMQAKHWKSKVIMMLTLLSQETLQAVGMKTNHAISEEVGIRMTLSFQWKIKLHHFHSECMGLIFYVCLEFRILTHLKGLNTLNLHSSSSNKLSLKHVFIWQIFNEVGNTSPWNANIWVKYKCLEVGISYDENTSFNSLRLSDAYMHQYIGTSLVLIMACRWFNAKP